MTKKAKITIVVIVAAVIALGAPLWWYAFSSKKAMADFRPIATGAIADGVVAIRDDFVNAWAFRAGGSWILFDAGTDAKRLLSSLGEAGIRPGEVKAIFLTHTDYDHVAAVSSFPNAVCYLPEAEVPLITGKLHRRFIFNNRFDAHYRTLRDSEVTRIEGREIVTLVTAGHTPGSACYLVDGAYLVTGDTLAARDGKIGTFSDFFNMDSAEQRRSSAELFGRVELRKPVTILTAHYGALRDYLAQ